MLRGVYNKGINKSKRGNNMKNLTNQYKEWREIQKEFAANTDCGEANVKEDFEAHIGHEISFEDMLELEREYER